MYVCGADHAQKCHLFAKLWCVVMARPGTETGEKCKAVLIESEEQNGEISSTAVRKAVSEGNVDSVASLLHPAVLAELKKRGREMFVWN
jgi:FAD synthase